MEDACLSFSLIIPLMENAPTHTNSSSYAAFISYRHLPRDAEVACEVQRAIEEYRLPRLVARANAPAETTSNTACAFPEADAYAEIAHKEAILHTENASIGTTTHNKDTFNAQEHKVRRPTKLGKCFRDEDELAASHSLPDSIREALAASRTLIVICSPETQESSWVRREIEMFEQIHGRERIICVLAAGSPEESIPPILKTRMVPDANGVLREMPAEPLAADLRPEAKTKRKAELLNLDLPNDVAEYIANHLKQNIRQLEGAVKKLNAYYMLEGIEPCIGVTTTAIKDTLNDSQPIPVTIEKILNEVARTYNVMPADIRGKKRHVYHPRSHRHEHGGHRPGVPARSFHRCLFHQNDGGKHQPRPAPERDVQRHHEKRPHLAYFLERK